MWPQRTRNLDSELRADLAVSVPVAKTDNEANKHFIDAYRTYVHALRSASA